MKRRERLKENKKAGLVTLLKKETNLKKKLVDLKMKLASNKLKNTAQIKNVRREIALTKTLIFEKAALAAVNKEDEK
jgi:ribosomal protein L29